MTTNEALFDTAGYLVYDIVKSKKLPTVDDAMESAFTSFGYHWVLKNLSKYLTEFMPVLDPKIKDEFEKFIGEVGANYAYRYIKGQSTVLMPIVMKQLVVQGGALVYKQI